VGSNQGFGGMDFVGFIVCYSGPASAGENVLKRLRSAGRPIVDTVGPIDYVALQRSGDVDETRAVGSYTKTGFVKRLSPKLIDALLAGLEPDPNRSLMMGFQHCGGAISRVAADATAFPHRDIHATALLTADWPATDDPEKHVTWLRRYWKSIEPHTDGFYTNDVVDETQKQVDENYLHNYPRLVALKTRYDPLNLFRLNANIRPKTQASAS
jgi:hypothetical protein